MSVESAFRDRNRAVFELIETMRWDPGEGHYLLERHLHRLAGSAAHFGFVFDREAIVAALRIEPSATPNP